MSAKVKLISCIFGIIIAFCMLITGVYAATQQKITMQGSVDINVSDRTLYLRDVRVQHDTSQTPTTIPGFRKGYINKSFQLDLTDYDLGTNNTSSIVLYFDIVNLIIDGQTSEYIAEASWAGSSVEGVTFSIDAGSERIDAGTVSPENFNSSTPLSGTVVLEINVLTSTSFDLSSIKLTIRERVDLSDVEYTIGENNEIIIESWGDGENIVIPGSESIVDGQLVDGGDYTETSIADNAFTGNSTVKTVTLPDTIKSIGDNAFQKCSNLTTVNLPDGLTEIGEGAFNRCGKLTDIVLPDTLTTIGPEAFFLCQSITGTLNIPASVTTIGRSALVYLGIIEFTVDGDNPNYTALDGILYNKNFTTLVAYPTSKATNNYVMRESVTTVEWSAFRYAKNLTGTLTLSPKLTTIMNNAFHGCINLSGTLSIPASVTYIGEGPFTECRFTEYIIEGGNNSYYAVEDGVLYNADKTTLIQFPTEKTAHNFTLPDSVKTIGAEAFVKCNGLTGEIVLPENITTIGGSAFYRCDSFTSITLPASLNTINSSAFYYCASLNTIRVECSTISSNGPDAFIGCDNLKTVFISSPEIASKLTSRTALFCLINAAETVYIAESAASSLPTEFASMFSEVTPSDQSGYRKYTA